MERKPEWKTKEERIQDTPTILTLSDQKKPPFPAERKKHPQTTRKKEEQTFSLLPKEATLPYRRKQERFSLPPAEKSQLPKSQKDSPPPCQKPYFISPTAKRTPFPTAEKTTSLSPPLKTK